MQIASGVRDVDIKVEPAVMWLFSGYADRSSTAVIKQLLKCVLSVLLS
ncbi:hypothetical protein PF66_02286 [Pseudomonas asplenii]|uniref:Uncharacterized protein n=1 Tax=Pseudomonas asplenii TaxID=53407 RepID=A0A0M9GHX0_9PSED|nr:hypothetical protein PF66_02286 [Pseudomonas fuscovaginae]